MLSGWINESQSGQTTTENSNQVDTQPLSNAGVLREWSRANERYNQEAEEEVGIDPFSTGDDVSSIGAWSVPAGVIESEGAKNPFKDDSSFANHGSSVQSPPRSDSGPRSMNVSDACASPNSQPTSSVFDDVDLEAVPSAGPPHIAVSSANNPFSFSNGRRERGSITTRVIFEMRTNPNARFRTLMAISGLLVVSCIVAIAVTVSKGESAPPPIGGSVSVVDVGQNVVSSPVEVETNSPSSTPTAVITDAPTFNPTSSQTTNSPSMNPSKAPTKEPTAFPTSYPTSFPTYSTTTAMPTMHPTTSEPTRAPSATPTTFSPTMDCTDHDGVWMTYNGKMRDCQWLDNGFNGALSDRKDLNCNNSTLGVMCSYTCRLYNGCMDYLIASQTIYVDGGDYSVGDSCSDKPGVYIANGNVPRNCTWLDEDPSTAPIKKNFNCGTPENPRTELGIMCPQSCAGYNSCTKIQKAPSNPLTFYDGDGESETESYEPINKPADPLDNELTDIMTPLDSDVEDNTCTDLDGNWTTHDGKIRKCRWFNRGDIEYKLKMNCHITEIGLKCRESCGCGNGNSTQSLDTISNYDFDDNDEEENDGIECVDERGAWMTSDRVRKQCDWLERFHPMERKQLNCGKTEIGLKCSCMCPNVEASKSAHNPSESTLIQDVMWDYKEFLSDLNEPSNPPTESKRAPKTSEGWLNDDGDILTLIPHADATVSLDDFKDNFGDSSELRVTHPDHTTQGLLQFDLTFFREKFGSVVGQAILRIYATAGDPTGSVTFKKMSDPIWREGRVTWNNMPGGEGSQEPIVSFLDRVESQVWYEISVTAAVRDVLSSGEEFLGIRISSEEAEVAFASKEEEEFQPQLIIDTTTLAPTLKPTQPPTHTPTESPTLSPPLIDCLDKKGVFQTHTGALQPCSWFDVGNGQLKKELNCQGLSEAAYFCQSKCSAYNGCDGLTCEDKSGAYLSNTGVRQNCSWLISGNGALKLEHNCGSDAYQKTELGEHCQATCGTYNGCSTT